jgi:RHS repeat-associated protein
VSNQERATDNGVYITAKDARAWRHLFGLDQSGNIRDFIGGFLGADVTPAPAPVFGGLRDVAQRERWPNASAPKLGPDGSIFISHDESIARFAPSSMVTSYVALPNGYSVPSKGGDMLYQFDQRGRHLRTLNAYTGGLLLRFQYDAQGQVTEQIDGDGDVLSITRSANSIRLTAPDGQVTDIARGAGGFATRVTAAATAQQWQLGYVGASTGLLTSFQRPNAHPASTFGYLNGVLTVDRNARGGGFDFKHSSSINGSDFRQSNISRVQGSRREIVKYRNDQLGYSRFNFPDGSSSSVASSGAMTRVGVSPQGMRTASQQQSGALFGLAATFNQRSSAQTPAGLGYVRSNSQAATATMNAALGSVNLDMASSVRDLAGDTRLRRARYNATTRTWTHTSAELRTSTSQIDAQGRPLRTQFADLAPTVYEYDARGRFKKLTVGEGTAARVTELSYDSFGFVNLVKDPLLREVSLTNDAVGRTRTMRLPDLREVEFEFDANNNVTGVKPPTRDWHRFRYDSTDNLAGYDPPNLAGISTPATNYGYNLHPRLTNVTRPDARNVTLVQIPGEVGPTKVITPLGDYSYSYLTGRVQTVDAPPQNDGSGSCSSTLRYEFDGTLMLSVAASGCPGAGTVAWEHTGFFEAKSLKITAGTSPTLTTALLRDKDSLLTNVGAITLTRDPLNGLLNATTLGQIDDSYTYNSFAEPLSYSVTTPLGLAFSQTFVRDKLGRITQKTEAINGVTTQFNYGYDQAGRLETVKENNVLQATYSFDGNSNRTAKVTPLGTTNGTVDGQDRLTSYAGCTYQYTANGEMARKTCGGAITQFDIDVMGNLRSVTLPNSTQIRYLIDGANRRTGKLRNNVLEKSWLWQSQLHPAAQLDAAGNATQFYLYADKANVPSYLVNRESGTNVTYRLISDHLGSVRLVINAATGVVAQRIRYDEFGVVLEDTNPGFQPFGYAGGLYDADTGLIRFGARDYEAVSGRWIKKDILLKSPDSLNYYEYAHSDPINLVDQTGKTTVVAGAEVGFLLGGPPGAVVGAVVGSVVLVASVVWAANHDWGDDDDGEETFKPPKPRKGGTPAPRSDPSAKPDGCPAGTLPIDDDGLNLDKPGLHGLKNDAGAKPNTWTGVAPDGSIWINDGTGKAVNTGGNVSDASN